MSVYFDRKNELKEKALKHTEKMEEQFENEIQKCVENTLVYGEEANPAPVALKRAEGIAAPKVYIDTLDSVSSIFSHHTGKTAVLNFASYKNPGGKFIEGSSAQEECLCHASYLYNVLLRMPKYYKWNKDHINKALYLDRALYTPDITFFSGTENTDNPSEIVKADVITCAAPNISTAERYAGVLGSENLDALLDRIKFVLNIAMDNHVDTLILGAFGCGVFGQNATIVARYFAYALKTYDYHLKNIYFSILNRGNNDNYTRFKEGWKWMMSQD